MNKRLESVLCGDSVFMVDLFHKQLQMNGFRNFSGNSLHYMLSVKQVIQLSSRLAIWPTDIDTAELKHDLIEIQIPGQTSKCVSYAGTLLGRNRCFVANNHFPVLGKVGSLQSVSSFPFTKVVYDPNLQCSIPIISGIAYYEITVHPQIPVAGVVEEADFMPCVVIGIANHLHRMTKMPGWDAHSYGFHGDDGMFFHRWENEGFQFTEDPEVARFGQGDTVGFGIIYSRLARRNTQLFLTKNGAYIGKLNETNTNFENCAWFPCVGTDAHCPIEMNLGNKGVPFMFDLLKFEADTRVKHGKDPLALANLPIVPAVPSVTFRTPYHECNHFAGGLFRNRTFMKQVKEHVENSTLSSSDDDDGSGPSMFDSETSEWETVDDDEEEDEEEDDDEDDDDSDTGSNGPRRGGMWREECVDVDV